ncbi:hypothetical protein K435DRAFT_973652 [Dendrothele bispora CBS 962.96]|uniref:Uncharacterized protein n=1 Tax=Dendrothele bispora (strain CBS 962.96) TaxID=1314807 RepID=A0A4S8KR82_DENBC|nr:hypothetical protein K435DRAFT_973652 [Dendrothele bispora CBS 962.96]
MLWHTMDSLVPFLKLVPNFRIDVDGTYTFVGELNESSFADFDFYAGIVKRFVFYRGPHTKELKARFRNITDSDDVSSIVVTNSTYLKLLAFRPTPFPFLTEFHHCDCGPFLSLSAHTLSTASGRFVVGGNELEQHVSLSTSDDPFHWMTKAFVSGPLLEEASFFTDSGFTVYQYLFEIKRVSQFAVPGSVSALKRLKIDLLSQPLCVDHDDDDGNPNMGHVQGEGSGGGPEGRRGSGDGGRTGHYQYLFLVSHLENLQSFHLDIPLCKESVKSIIRGIHRLGDLKHLEDLHISMRCKGSKRRRRLWDSVPPYDNDDLLLPSPNTNIPARFQSLKYLYLGDEYPLIETLLSLRIFHDAPLESLHIAGTMKSEEQWRSIFCSIVRPPPLPTATTDPDSNSGERHAKNLESLKWSQTLAHLTFQAYASLHKCLSPGESLQTSPSSHRGGTANVSSFIFPLISPSSPLLQAPIQTIRIIGRFQSKLYITDKDVSMICDAWGSTLTDLELEVKPRKFRSFPEEEEKAQKMFTESSLKILRERCPELKRVTMPYPTRLSQLFLSRTLDDSNTSMPTTARANEELKLSSSFNALPSSTSPRSHKLEFIHFLMDQKVLINSCPVFVGYHLDAVFPYLKTLLISTLNSRRGKLEGTVSNKPWEKVMAAIRTCRKLKFTIMDT